MILKFRVREQTIRLQSTKAEPRQGSKEYLELQFSFSSGWNDLLKYVYLQHGEVSVPHDLADGSVIVDEYFTEQTEFNVTLFGKSANDSVEVPTNVITVFLKESNNLWEKDAPEPQNSWVVQVIDARDEALAAAIRAENAAIHQPYPNSETGTWWVWNVETGKYEDTGEPSRGETGPQGPTGPAGADGKDGAGIDITGATVGQIAKITAVDDTGKPTAWEAIDIPQSDWEQTDESAADYVKNRPFGNFEHHNIDFYLYREDGGKVEKAPMFDELLNVVGEKTARIELHGSIYCQGTAVTVIDEADGNIRITFTSDDNLNELVFSGQYGNLTDLTINKSNITWDTWNTYSLFIDGLTYTIYQKLSKGSVEGTLPYVYEKDYIPVSGGDDSWITRSIESINPIFQLSGASAGQTVKITAVDESGKPTAWEAVDMPIGGGGETWELIAEIDFDVDAANNVSVWEYKNLPNYKELAYKKVGLVGSTETASGISISINDSYANYSGIQYSKKNGQSNGWGKILLLPFGWIHVNSGSANLPTNYAFTGLQTMYNAIPFDGDSITSVKLFSHSTYKIAGGKLSLYGRR